MQTILGGNGTIGSILAKELSLYTDKVRLVSRNPKQVNATDDLMPMDLSNPDSVDKAVAGSEVVYLLVGFEYKLKVWQRNWPMLMKAVIEACSRHNAKLVFFDNVYAYDKQSISHMTEDVQLNPPSKKGLVRMELVEMLMTAVKAGKLKALIARAADFYGPGNERSMFIEMVIKNMKKGKKPMWLIDADKKHSFTYTPDAAKATAILGNTEDAYGQVWHLPTDPRPLSVRELVKLYPGNKNRGINSLQPWFVKLLGVFIPVMKEMPEMLYQYERDYFFDSSKFNRRFNFKPTSYEEGMASL
jgi:nucleoside-diphosphate-sugar epimerase